MVKVDLIAAIQFTEVAQQQIGGIAPGLAVKIADILHLQPCFLHNFPADRGFRPFAELTDTGNQSHALELPACIPGHKNFIIVGHRHDDSRGNDRKRKIAAAARQGPQGLMVVQGLSAFAAEPVALVPVVQVPGRHARAAQLLRRTLSQQPHGRKFIPRHSFPAQIKGPVIDGEQVL